MGRNVQDLTKDDFPLGVKALKWKHGLYYRPNNCGYTRSLLEAGLYSREDAISDGFDPDGKNGKWEVYAMPLWMAIEQGYWSIEKIDKHMEQLKEIKKYSTEQTYNTVIF